MHANETLYPSKLTGTCAVPVTNSTCAGDSPHYFRRTLYACKQKRFLVRSTLKMKEKLIRGVKVVAEILRLDLDQVGFVVTR